LASERLGQSVVVENRPGARATLGAQFLKTQARPDGHTLTLFNFNVLRQQFMVTPPPWNALQDFTYIANAIGFAFGIATSAGRPWRTLDELLAAARAAPGRITFASSAVGSTGHLLMEALSERTGTQFTHVPYTGQVAALTAVLSGQVDLVSDSPLWAQHMRDGTLRALCVATRDRLPNYPDVPTLRELGFDVNVVSEAGYVGPAGVPDEIVRTLADTVQAVLQNPEEQALQARLDLYSNFLGPADYRAMVARRLEFERETVRRLNLRAD
jgi:tripartite-type tricarboxylate transporter receptor subunit TctC